jgi:ketosteroid isomerase-like protein
MRMGRSPSDTVEKLMQAINKGDLEAAMSLYEQDAIIVASSDVLRRQADGRWLVAIDNPWGTGIIG